LTDLTHMDQNKLEKEQRILVFLLKWQKGRIGARKVQQINCWIGPLTKQQHA